MQLIKYTEYQPETDAYYESWRWKFALTTGTGIYIVIIDKGEYPLKPIMDVAEQ